MSKRSFCLLIVLAAFALCAGAATATEPNTTNNVDRGEVTWSEHVAPILFNSCVDCHRPGQVAPMSLLSYDETRPWAKSIRRATAERTMPPWFANPAHGTFKEDPRLTEDEIDTIARWVAAGAPAGDLDAAPEIPSFDSDWRIGEPDVVFTMEPFEVTDEMEDHYQWLRIDNHLDEDRWIKAIEIRPTFMEAAHHNLTYVAPAGTTLADVQGVGRMDMDYITGWAPGVMPLVYKEGYGKLLPAKSTIFFQMHYHKTPGPDTGGIDETAVGVKFYEGEVENALTTMWVVDPALSIPPGEANYASTSDVTFEHDVVLFNFTPHMHLRGKAMKFTAEYPDGSSEILLDVPNFDFNWQLTYTPPAPLEIPAGTKITVDAVFDNSADNAANPNPEIMVTWGEKTTDEMMIGFMDYSYVERELQTDMPTHSVPAALRPQFEQIREFRDRQKKAETAAGLD